MSNDPALLQALMKTQAELFEAVLALHRRLDAAGIPKDPRPAFSPHDETRAAMIVPEPAPPVPPKPL